MRDEEFISTFKSRVLEVFKYSIGFFEKHHLHWFIACGSAIGAVRHKGFIPWDDDVDVAMPRADYEKLKSLSGEMLKDGYRFLDWDEKNYPLAFGKISDNNTTLWSKKRFPVNFGIYIDIFPLDLTDSGMMAFGKKWQPYRLLLLQYRAKLSKVSLGDVVRDIFSGKKDSLRVLMVKIPLMFVSKKSFLKKIKTAEQDFNHKDGDRYVSYTESGMYMFPRKWFEEYILMPFEDIKEVRVPKYYDEYLTYMYGDYMTPPPESQQIPEGPHGKYYVNFEQNVPLAKVRRMVRNTKGTEL